MPRTKPLCVLSACIALVASSESSTEVRGSTNYRATMNGANEKPNAVTTNGTGTFSASLHPTNFTFSYTATWTGLTGNVIGAHIHGPADQNQTAGVLVDFSATPAGSTNRTITTGASGSASASLDLKFAVTPTVSGTSLRKLLDAGLLYVNVHTAANPTGEIRAQITK